MKYFCILFVLYNFNIIYKHIHVVKQIWKFALKSYIWDILKQTNNCLLTGSADMQKLDVTVKVKAGLEMIGMVKLYLFADQFKIMILICMLRLWRKNTDFYHFSG